MNNTNYNRAELTGIIVSRPEFIRTYGQKKKLFTLEVKRDSGYPDRIQIMTDASHYFSVGSYVTVAGELRSRRDYGKLILYVNAFRIEISKPGRKNQVEFTAYSVNEVNTRMTPGGRIIADIMAAVNRKDGKTSYIPCIIWGHKAEKVEKIKIGSNICITGRIQSRQYSKNYDIKSINEVCILKMQ